METLITQLDYPLGNESGWFRKTGHQWSLLQIVWLAVKAEVLVLERPQKTLMALWWEGWNGEEWQRKYC